MTDDLLDAEGVVRAWRAFYAPEPLGSKLDIVLDALDAARKERDEAWTELRITQRMATVFENDRVVAAEAERDELQAALEELRRRWDELVVAANPSVFAAGEGAE